MPDFNGIDQLHLADLRIRLRTWFEFRKGQGALVKDMEDSVGRSHGFLALLNDETRLPWDWYWSTFHSLATALGLKPVAEVSGFDLPQTPMLGVGLANPTFLGIGLLEAFKQAREDQGMSYEKFGERMDLVKSGVYKLEVADDPKLMSIMRYARGLGGRIRFGIEVADV